MKTTRRFTSPVIPAPDSARQRLALRQAALRLWWSRKKGPRPRSTLPAPTLSDTPTTDALPLAPRRPSHVPLKHAYSIIQSLPRSPPHPVREWPGHPNFPPSQMWQGKFPRLRPVLVRQNWTKSGKTATFTRKNRTFGRQTVTNLPRLHAQMSQNVAFCHTSR